MPTHHPHNEPRPTGGDGVEGRAHNGIRWPVVVLGLALLLIIAVVLIAGGFIA